MNAVQLSRSVLLTKMRGFYALVVRLKEEIDQKGAEISVERVQGELRSYIDNELRAQGEDESGSDRLDAITAYKAVHLLSVQCRDTPGAKATKMLGRRFLQTSGAVAAVAEPAADELAKLRFPTHTLSPSLPGQFHAAYDIKRRARSAHATLQHHLPHQPDEGRRRVHAEC